MLTNIVKYLKSSQKGKHITIDPSSQLRNFVRRTKSPAEVAWLKKMRV